VKQFLKRLATRLARSAGDEFELEFGASIRANETVAQKVLMQQYRFLALSGTECLPSIDDVGFRIYSQFEEDGILLYIFSLLAPVNRVCVEICAGNGRECMATNLIINHGWWGYLFDGSERNVRDGRRYFSNHKDTSIHPPAFTAAWITAENVNDLLVSAGITGEIDLLSLDLDGMDYWIWKAISEIQPRVVVCETHNAVPRGRAVTVPYDPQFVCQSEHYRGASLEAMCRLGAAKGYRLVGTHRFGFNAFFVRNGLEEELLPVVPPSACLNDPFSEKRRLDWSQVAGRPWQEIT
jgi:hypothetical protein